MKPPKAMLPVDGAKSIREALGLFASAIKSGERWTETCEAAKVLAYSELKALTDRAKDLEQRNAELQTANTGYLEEARDARRNFVKLQNEYKHHRSYQMRVWDWVKTCFRDPVAHTVKQRGYRFGEEALELLQAIDITREEMHQLVDYVCDRDQGAINREVGGVSVTLAALCEAAGWDVEACAEGELARVWTKLDDIRKKDEAKMQAGPLPGPSTGQPLHSSLQGAHAPVGDGAASDDTGFDNGRDHPVMRAG